MKTIAIERLTLRNFKGIKEFILTTSGCDCSIFGDNGTGKTTLFDAFCWLLFDKDSQGKAAFEVKTLTREGEVLHGLEHEVECILNVDGRATTLRKILTEKWTKKRGSAQSEFTGHTTSYFVDEIPVQLKDYRDAVGRIADESMFKLLTSPTYFNEQLKWTERRTTLLDVCGDISDADVIASDSSLLGLPAILKNRKLKDHKKVITDQQKELNEKLKSIPVRISEVDRNMPDVSSINAEVEQNIMSVVDDSLRAEQEKLLRAESGGQVTEKQIELRKIEAELMQLKTEYQGEIRDEINKLNAQRNVLSAKISTADNDISVMLGRIESNKLIIKNNTDEMARLRNDYNRFYAEQFSFEQNTNCPTCGQPLPEDQLQAARDRAQENFNQKKSEKLESINGTGRLLKIKVTEIELANKELQAKADSAGSNRSVLAKQLETLNKKLSELNNDHQAYNSTLAYKDALSRAGKIKQEIAALQQGQQVNTEPIRQRIASLQKDKDEVKGKLFLIKQAKTSQDRIAELKQQERDLSAEYEQLEKELYLCEQFTKAQANLLSEKVNGKFRLARFKLFETQVNGGVTPICETTFQGVPYSTGLNHGAQINVGLDIINTLSGHYGLSLPIFVDNSEAVTRLIEVSGQIIRLIVSEQDKKLRIESGVTRQAERHVQEQMALV